MMSATLPIWARLGFLGLISVVIFGLGVMYGDERTGQKHIDYITHQAAATVKLVRAQQVVVTKVETKYRDRIKTIYLNGDDIEKSVRDYISPAANAACTINLGFVRVHDAAWTSTVTGAASESDGEPTGISLAETAETTAHNAKACLAWREQALGWREYYDNLKALIEAK